MILGGDVYFSRKNRIEIGYENWHADRDASGNYDAYRNRSWDVSERFIRDFPEPDDREPVFVIVTQ